MAHGVSGWNGSPPTRRDRPLTNLTLTPHLRSFSFSPLWTNQSPHTLTRGTFQPPAIRCRTNPEREGRAAMALRTGSQGGMQMMFGLALLSTSSSQRFVNGTFLSSVRSHFPMRPASLPSARRMLCVCVCVCVGGGSSSSRSSKHSISARADSEET